MWKSYEHVPIIIIISIIVLPMASPWGNWMVPIPQIPHVHCGIFCLEYFQTMLLSQPVIFPFSQWVTDSSLCKVKNNPLKFFTSSPYYFYSARLALIDTFHPHGIYFLFTLWKMRKVTYTKEQVVKINWGKVTGCAAALFRLDAS